MSNSFGKIFKLTTFGESHGGCTGGEVDGCPPNLELSESDIQKELDRRKPGQSDSSTPRKEEDKRFFEYFITASELNTIKRILEKN